MSIFLAAFLLINCKWIHDVLHFFACLGALKSRVLLRIVQMRIHLQFRMFCISSLV
ncbi:hypothetical protein KP509_15G023000 [Ceratopteris richardii]|uniref:Uncharacterized protein n=1 Tax=Ceratopteris richardii TaxID=49495 RepID=A0A8T2T3U5_CERRI|nr:hypothetical protein KP509_15G023000 [Ceratopteris richardii]